MNDGDGSEFENRNVKDHDVGSGEEGNNAGIGEEDVNGINDEEVGDVASSEKNGEVKKIIIEDIMFYRTNYVIRNDFI